MIARWAGLAALLAWHVCAPPPALAQDTLLGAARYRPDLQFRTVTTGRIDVHFHQGAETLAARLVRIIEEVAPHIERRYGSPRGRVHVILVDQTDLANGWATVIPYNLIEITAVPPQSGSVIGHTDDWLRLVFAHEYTHVLHLEKSGGWLGGFRRIFGRLPAFYPNLFLPDWQIEGLATQMESAVTGHGRVPAGDFRMILHEAAAAGRFPSLDRATGAVIDWPGGTSAYLYGAYFHEYLARRFGPEALDRLTSETGARIPFTGSLAYRKVFGESLGSLWSAFEADVRARAADPFPSERTRLTHHGFSVSTPAFAADGRLFYSVANPHNFPSLMEYRPGLPPRTVAARFLGEALSISGQTAVFDQLEFSANVGLLSDLYVLSLDSGTVRRLTRGARAAHPDISRDGRTVICTVQQTGRRILATVDLSAGAGATPHPFLEEDATEFSAPRWSPDGRNIAAERRRLGGPSEIVIIDAATRALRTMVTSGSARHLTPAWADQGTVLFASDRAGGPFTLHALDVASGEVRQLAGAGAGVQWPIVSPEDGRIVFVGYSADGYDLYSVPGERPASAAATPPRPGVETATRHPSPPLPAETPMTARPYSPLATLAPRFWLPYLERDGDDLVLGAGTGGFDALGRHSYVASAGVAMPRNRLDVHLAYSYLRWRPSIFAAVSDDTDAWREGYIRTRELSAGVLFPLRRVRWSTSALVAATRSADTFEVTSPAFTPRPDRDRSAGRLGWSLSTARGFGYSISAEEGAAINLTFEFARGGSAGARGAANTVVAEGRMFRAVWPRHAVLAGRLAGATSRGDRSVRRDFGAGGSGPQPGGFDVGVDAIGLLRGFDSADVFGRSASVLNLDYRVPLAWPQRGLGTLPVFLRSVHAALFFDAGHAWDERFRSADLRRSVGAELSFDTVVAWWLPATITTGGAWRQDPSRARDGLAVFVRIGRAF